MYSRRRSSNSNPKKFLVGSYASLANASNANIAINVPVDAAQGKGIQIWGVELEVYGAGALLPGTDAFSFSIEVARTAGTTERFVNDPDVIAKWKVRTDTAGTQLFEMVKQLDMYPAVPHISPQLHVSIRNDTGDVLTVYAKVWYTDFYVSYPQAVGLLQSQVI